MIVIMLFGMDTETSKQRIIGRLIGVIFGAILGLTLIYFLQAALFIPSSYWSSPVPSPCMVC